MTRPKKIKKTAAAKPEPSITLNLKITVPRRVAWMTSGFLTGSAATEAITRVLRSIHGA
jgi:hypothetical protein